MKDTLLKLQDKKYQVFQKRIIPYDETIIGVRTPILRKLAKQLVNEKGIEALSLLSDETYEERLLQGMIITYSKLSYEEILPYVIRHISKINNWALCDLFCGDLKFTKEHREEMLEFITPYLESKKTYEIRFGVVMLIAYYLNEQYCGFSFQYFDRIQSKEYYVQMAIAWAISRYYVSAKDQTIRYLNNNQLDDFTYNKALQKILDSLIVSKEEKDKIRSMKRKK